MGRIQSRIWRLRRSRACGAAEEILARMSEFDGKRYPTPQAGRYPTNMYMQLPTVTFIPPPNGYSIENRDGWRNGRPAPTAPA